MRGSGRLILFQIYYFEPLAESQYNDLELWQDDSAPLLQLTAAFMVRHGLALRICLSFPGRSDRPGSRGVPTLPTSGNRHLHGDWVFAAFRWVGDTG